MLATREVDPIQLVLTIVLLVISLSVHEAAHGWVAWKCGDPTAKELGRITLNPIPHIDPFMTVILPAIMYYSVGFVFGGAKPVPVNFHRLRHPWRDMSLVALAGPGSNLLLAVFFIIAWKFFMTTGWYNNAADLASLRDQDLLPQILKEAVFFNVLLAVFNLIPIPPLDGSRVMAWLLPPNLRESYGHFERFGLFIVVGLIFLSPGFNALLHRSIDGVVHVLDRAVSLGGVW
jgi:Zn-dependent protease